jgi:hypothetical protein
VCGREREREREREARERKRYGRPLTPYMAPTFHPSPALTILLLGLSTSLSSCTFYAWLIFNDIHVG